MAQKKFKDMKPEEKRRLFKALLASVLAAALIVLQIVLAIHYLFGDKETQGGPDPVLIDGVWERETSSASSGSGTTDLSRAVSITVDADGNATISCVDEKGSAYIVVGMFGESGLTLAGEAHKYSISDNKGRGGKNWCLSITDTNGRVYFYK